MSEEHSPMNLSGAFNAESWRETSVTLGARWPRILGRGATDSESSQRFRFTVETVSVRIDVNILEGAESERENAEWEAKCHWHKHVYTFVEISQWPAKLSAGWVSLPLWYEQDASNYLRRVERRTIYRAAIVHCTITVYKLPRTH